MTTSSVQRISLLSAIALTVLVLASGLVPSTGSLFQGVSHWVVHLFSFAILGFAWRSAVPRVPPLIVALAVIAFGFAHEAIEIIGHAHAYELHDAIVDGVGAMIGVLVAQSRKR